MQKTVILLKPDCMERNLAGEVIGRFERAGLKIKACRMMRLSDELLKEHYSHLADKPFFPEILNFMQSTPVIAMALEGEDAVSRVRDLLGPTDSKVAPPGSIRGDLGTDKMRNIAHASDSDENASAELARFFRSSEVF